MREAFERAVAGLTFIFLLLFSISAGTAHAASTTYGYDPLGRVVSATYGNGVNIRYAYDAAGNRTQLSGLAITTTAIALVIVGRPYSQQIVFAGGTGSVGFQVTGGQLPPGLSISPAGLISGTPTNAAPFSFTVTAAEAGGLTTSMSYSGTSVTAPSITTPVLATPILTRTYNVQIAETGGTGTIVFSFSGTLPTGLSLSPAGVLSGTPTQPGNFAFSVTAADANGLSSSPQPYNVNVSAGPAITTASLNTMVLNHFFSQTIAETGGTGTITYSVSAGLPGGMSLSPAGILSGTPNQAGTFNFTVTVTDINLLAGSQPYVVTIVPAPVITTASLTTPVLTKPYTPVQIGETGGTGTITFSTSGNVPPGMGVGASGVFSGTPTQAGTWNFTVTATDVNGLFGSQNYSLPIAAAPAITTTSLPTPVLNVFYSAQIGETGGTGTIAFGSPGPLPVGLTLTTGGLLSGTPNAPGTFGFTVTATDVNGLSGSQPYNVTVIPFPPIANPASPTLPYNSPGTVLPLTITGGAPASVSIIGGPSHGIVSSINGVSSITYKPNTNYFGPDSITYQATNAGGSSSAALSITVVVPAISVSIPAGETGSFALSSHTFNTHAATVAGGSGSFTYIWQNTNDGNGVWNTGGTASSFTPSVSGVTLATGCVSTATYSVVVTDTVTHLTATSNTATYQWTNTSAVCVK